MILDYKKDVAYICPVCANINMEQMRIFDFSGNRHVELICTDNCDGKCVIVKRKKDKYHINVDCPLCGGVHNFTMDKSLFWHTAFHSFTCPASGIEIYFLGEYKKVIEAVKNQEKMLSELQEPEQISDLSEMLDMFSEYDEWLDVMMENIGRIASNDAISCSCGSKDISVIPQGEQLVFACESCKMQQAIPITREYLELIMGLNSIIIN